MMSSPGCGQCLVMTSKMEVTAQSFFLLLFSPLVALGARLSIVQGHRNNDGELGSGPVASGDTDAVGGSLRPSVLQGLLWNRVVVD